MRLIIGTELPGSGYEGGTPTQRGRTFEADEPVQDVIDFITAALGDPQQGVANALVDEREEDDLK